MRTDGLYHIDKQTASLLAIPWKHIDSNYTLPDGVWKAVNVFQQRNLHSYPTPFTATGVDLFHESWDEADHTPLLLVMDEDGNAVMPGGAYIPDPVTLVFETVGDLEKANDGRTICAGCGKPLNVLSVNLRICNPCEKTLDTAYQGIVEDNEEDYREGS
jgi:hypothetical protein